jgi:peptidoglycan/LPS O-acetylase OafA/YrhL
MRLRHGAQSDKSRVGGLSSALWGANRNRASADTPPYDRGMSRNQLQVVGVVNAVIIACLAVVAWAGDYLPLAFAIAMIAGMGLQIVAVVRPESRPERRPENTP